MSELDAFTGAIYVPVVGGVVVVLLVHGHFTDIPEGEKIDINK